MTHTVSPLSRLVSGTLIALTIFGGVYHPAAAASLSKLANDSTGAVAAAAISCNKDRIISGVSSLFGGLKSGKKKTVSGNTVPVNVSADSSEAEQTAASAASTTQKLNCWNVIEKAAAQTILKELTLTTINWINHGLDNGDPLFPKDTGSFLKDIGDQEVKQFVRVIGFDSKNYPFGRIVAQNLIGQLSAGFEQRSRYSLDQVIGQQYPGMGSADFQRDFGYGGWDAFLAQSFSNNNPYGFTMQSQETINSRIGDTGYSTAQDIRDQLLSSGGFLSTKKCVDPRNYDPNAVASVGDSAADDISVCRRWETQTPGSVISATLNKALGTPFDQLALGQDLTSDLTAIFDTLINHFVQKGLSYLSSTGSSSGSDMQYSNNSSYVPNVSIDRRGSVSLSGSWFEQQDGTFNVFTDIPNLIYNECNNVSAGAEDCYYLGAPHNDPKLPQGYQQLLEQQTYYAELLIPAIHQLDYCIPGPHPTWREESLLTLQTFEGDQNELPINSDAAISSGAKIIHMITDPGNMFKEQGKEWTADKRNEKMYSGIVGIALSWKKEGTADTTGTGGITAGGGLSSGYFTSPDIDLRGVVDVESNFKVNGYNAVVNIFDKLFSRYAKAIDTEFTFNPEFTQGDMATHVVQNKREYRNLETYQQAIEDNRKLLDGSKGTVTQLQNLVKRIEALPTLDGYADTHPTGSATGATALTTQTTATLAVSGEAAKATVYPPKVPDVHHYKQDLQEALAIKNISLLSDYQLELKRINSAFALIAPNIHSLDDLTDQEAGLQAIMDVYYSYTIVPNGYIDLCIKDVQSKNYTGPKTRVAFPAELDVYLRNTSEAPNMVAPGLPSDLTVALKPDLSFLPNYFYGMGQRADQKSFFQSKYGIDQSVAPYKDRVIQNDDIVTINSQPIPNALRGFEQFIRTY